MPRSGRQFAGRAARTIATVAAGLADFCNPGTLVLGGGVLRTGGHLLMEGVTGTALLAIEHVFSPATPPRWVEDGSPLGHAADLQRLSSSFA
ncbi:hypothetical protein [Nonomuraea gerenzanensis]|uniref:Glucokinase n=1 Tax=Nonomuraea gerenzanensis TaxID=93944 RepID=A0A1M4EBG3_9ACTN|nr:hypothetical protein [Nonomuraea gerenzanensis]UBU19175.1 hypothetical protein LCN96_25665 [Nonomuraea gerenzanensis]SBO96106.1 hypothetical protein BN4615_P5622 [Nonomuraea gerenzanensis]